MKRESKGSFPSDVVSSDTRETRDLLSDEIHTEVQSVIDSHPYLSWLGLSVESLAVGSARLSIPYRAELANPGGPKGLHGGVSSAVLDASGAVAVGTTADDPASLLGQGSLSTTDLNVSYLRPATGDLSIEAEAVHVGTSKAVSRIKAYVSTSESAHQEVIVGRGTYHLVEKR